MDERYINICNDCAIKAGVDHLFFMAPWKTIACEFCNVRKPTVKLDAGRKDSIARAIEEVEKMDENLSYEIKNVISNIISKGEGGEPEVQSQDDKQTDKKAL